MSRLHLHPLALCASAVLIGSIGGFGYVPVAHAATRTVTNCNDSGAGSLRAAVAAANSGDTVDLRSLTCSRVTLTSGAITVPQDNLQLLGRNRSALTLDGNAQSRVLQHTGQGTLLIRGLTITNGVDVENFAGGGCVRSESNVSIESSDINHCRTEAIRNPDDECETCPMGAWGGAIAARQVRLSNSTVASSRASAFDSQGGGVFAIDRVVMFRSRLTGNVATNGTGAFAGKEFVAHDSLLDHNGVDFDQSFAEQGAVYVFDGQAVLVRSAVVDNVAQGCAAVCVEGRGAIVDSTVARNQGSLILRFTEEGLIANSTIAVNRSGTAPVTDPLRCFGAILTPRLMLDSSIVALNTCGSNYALDIGALSPTTDTVIGAHNLVQFSRARLPADTLRVNPKLQTLRNNGGPTPTMALIDGSPAINRGSNSLSLSRDQRGDGFLRGVGSATDIGAFEVQHP